MNLNDLKMFHFLKSKLRNKKTLFFVLLFFVAIGIILPSTHLAVAGAWWPPSQWGSAFEAVGINIVNSLTALILGSVLIISALLSIIAGSLLKWTILITMTISFTSLDPARNTAVALGWPMVRDFANIFVVLGLIATALATILGWPEEWSAKKILPKLIIAALLINFSLVICGIFIDISNAATAYFLGASGNGIEGTMSTQAIKNIGTMLWNGFGANAESPIIFIVKILSNVVYNIVSSAVVSLYVLLFLFRIIALWILVILSPLAFIFAVFPAGQKFWTMWKDNFIQWCIIGIPGAFFLYLGEKLQTAMTGGSPQMSRPAMIPLTGGSGFANIMTAMVEETTNLFTFFIPSAFLVMGFLFTLQTSAMGASLAKQWGQKAALATGKFSGKIGETYANKVAGSRFIPAKIRLGEGQTIRGSATNLWNKGLEKTRIKGPGYAEQQRKAALAEAGKDNESDARMEAGGDALQRSVVASGAGSSAQSQADFSSAVRAQQKKGNKVEEKYLDQYNAINKDTSVYSKDPQFAHKDTKGRDEILAQRDITVGPSGTAYNKDGSFARDAIKEAEQVLRERSYIKLGAENLKAMSQDEKIKYIKNENANVAIGGDSERTSLAAQIYDEATEKKWLAKLGETKETGKAIAYHDQHFGSTTMPDAKKLDLHLSKYDKKGQKDINEKRAKDSLSALSGTALEREALKQTVEKVTVDKVIDIEGMDKEIWELMNEQQKRRFMEKAKPAEIRKLTAKLLASPVASQKDLEFIDYKKIDPEIIKTKNLAEKIEFADASTTQKLREAIQEGSTELKREVVDAIISTVDTLDLKKLSLIRKTDIDDSIDRVSSNPIAKASLKAKYKFNITPIPPTKIINAAYVAQIQAQSDAENKARMARALMPITHVPPTIGATVRKTPEEIDAEHTALQTPEVQSVVKAMDGATEEEKESMEQFLIKVNKIP